MHRRGIPSLAGCASTSLTFNSTTHSLSTACRHSSSSIPKRRQSPSPALAKDYREAARIANRVVDISAQAIRNNRWHHPNVYGGEDRRFTEAVKSTQNSAKLPSMDRQKFFSEPDDDSYSLNIQQVNYQKNERIEPGTLVEIRRNQTVAHGIVLYSETRSGKWIVYTLVSTGEIWPHAEADVMFAVASFTPLDLTSRCGIEPIPVNEHEIAARVQVLKQLRKFELAVEREYPIVSRSLRPLYEASKSSNLNGWSKISTNQAAKYIDPDSESIPTIRKFVVHKYLFQQHMHFIAEPTDFLAKETFWVRPQQHLDDLKEVERMIVRRDSRIGDFVEKAKHIIAAAREREQGTWKDAPSIQKNNDFKFTSDDLTILRFMQCAFRPSRTTQQDPYIFLQSFILKQIGLYKGDVDDAMMQRFLTDVGVIAPWEDGITREATLWQERTYTDSDLKMVLPARTAITSPDPACPLGPEDLYTHDIVASIRHDFGNLPVYVIDDVYAEELDDGISVEKIPSEPGHVWLHVHIADPTTVLPPAHIFSQQAFERLETLYFIDRTVPMLPRIPQVKNLSLHGASGAPQCVMTFSARIDEEGNIVDYKVRPGIVRNVHVLEYDQVDAAMGFPKVTFGYPFGHQNSAHEELSRVDQSLSDNIPILSKITKGLMAHRVKAGAISMTRQEVNVSLRSQSLPSTPALSTSPLAFYGFPEVVYKLISFKALESGSRLIVAECMRTAGRVASMFFRDRDIPAIRRIIGQIDTEKAGGIEELFAARDAQGYVDYVHGLRVGVIHPSAVYGLHPGPHTMLGIPDGEGYVRVTSPLRRFCDMLAHWQIKHALLSSSTSSPRLFTEDWLMNFAKEMRFKETRSKRVASSQQHFWALKYIEKWMVERDKGLSDGPNPLDTLVARIISPLVHNHRKQCSQHQVFLQDLGIKALLHNVDRDTAFEVGELVDVKIDSIRLGLKPLLTVVRR
ncbi:hypothetical protein AcV7_006584 [Taiwanofungus camphoratus]|nr:hypothetical protein AcV7_006584 [Antrodia cinnamomea]